MHEIAQSVPTFTKEDLTIIKKISTAGAVASDVYTNRDFKAHKLLSFGTWELRAQSPPLDLRTRGSHQKSC